MVGVRRVEVEGPAAEVGEGGGGGGGEHLAAGCGGGVEGLQPRRGRHGQARGAGIVHAAATPLEREREEGEREQLGGEEEQQVAPPPTRRRTAIGDRAEGDAPTPEKSTRLERRGRT